MPTNNQIKKLIREVIAEGIDLDIPDAEIERVVDARLAAVTKRLDALEKPSRAARKSPQYCEAAPQAAPAAKPARLDVLHARQTAIAQRKAAK